MSIFDKYPNSRFLKHLPDDSPAFPLRERIADLFSFLDGLEDPNFEQELDGDHPHAPLWEMMLAKILRSEGYQLTRKLGGPDFLVEKDGRNIFIEAICPTPGQESNPNSVPPIEYGAPIAQDVPVAQIVLRIRGALKAKKLKYDQYVQQGIVSADDICVIAICSSNIDFAAGLLPPAIMRATHGLGDPYVIFERGKGAVGQGIESRESIPKASGEQVDTTFFLSDDNSLISAVLYSESSFFSLPFDLFHDLLLVHNPRARVSLYPGFLKGIEEIWTVCCHGTSRWRAYNIGGPQQKP